MWVFRFPYWLNALSHSWHLYGFSPLWILLWTSRPSARVNRLLQTVHSSGFSLKCFRLCLARSRLLRQHLPHSVHLYLPLWIFICWRRPLEDEKRFPHWVHEYTFSPECILAWSFKCLLLVNRLWQTVHKYGLGLSSCGCSVTSSLLSGWFCTTLQLPVHTQYNNFICTQINNKQARQNAHLQVPSVCVYKFW